ncbi:single-stranded DNA-binding protein [Clostridioides difficile]|uniref:single-stranded DNA-binding protein n=1 Tax=Clostridioides difficile TaxID=1496 RepID=UPI001C156B44|nr:single-stranded DNA-binding protein [Clostridioides difficile]EKJ1811746.1 single-stranded DNA-binding protein [Clostridioides difficile]MBZ0658227.1 single-stranded DNA-binding protein [Clostridioides difficile]MCP8337834.1 single-stranded DNA-binding protein [Clostridioides difficile]MCP8365807.1 single-stranded DNA-binding protein [Clostridioides difficile]MCP8383264.1 single-stranded DNA-binding protein [Clostridioides difficile]
MNHVNLIGRLTKEPNIKCKENGNYVLYFDVAIDNQYSKSMVSYVPVEVNGKLVEKYACELFKGQLVAIEGYIKAYKNYFRVSTNYVRFLSKSNDTELKYTPEPITDDDEIPFKF